MAGRGYTPPKVWPGDRVCFKPRGPSLEKMDVSSVTKLLVGTFHGVFPGKKSIVSVLTPAEWNGIMVANEEVHPLPISTVDAVKITLEAFSEPANVDLLTQAVMRGMVDPTKTVTLSDKPVRTVLMQSTSATPSVHPPTPPLPAQGKTHLEASPTELRSGLFDAAIRKEFDSFVRWGVFGKQLSKQQA